MQLSFLAYSVTSPLTSSISAGVLPVPALAIKPSSAHHISPGRRSRRGRTSRATGEVHEGQVDDVGATDLEGHTVPREGDLGRRLVVPVKEALRLRARVEDRALRAADALRDLGGVEDRPAERDRAHRRRLAVLVREQAQADGALPRAGGVREPALGRAPAAGCQSQTGGVTLTYGVGETGCDANLVQVPLARGSVMPHMFSRSEDLPVLCEPMTAIIGISMSIETLRDCRQWAGRPSAFARSTHPVT